MSFTQVEHLFAGVDELGINDLLQAFFTARPRHLIYGTPALVPVTTVAATSIPALAFPGIPGGIQFAFVFSIPTVDINPDSSGGTAVLIPGAGEFTVTTTVRIFFQCGSRKSPKDQIDRGRPTFLETELRVVGLCQPVVISSLPGTGEIGIQVKRVEIVDIRPDSLESIVECLMLMILQSVLANVRLPFNALTAGAFGLILLAGPVAEADQIKVRGNAL